MTIGERLKKVRETLGFSQEAMAKFIKCSPRSWKGYESNSSVPGGDILANLANAGIDTNWILSGNVSKNENSIDIYDVEFSAGCGSFITEENIVSSLVLPEDFFDIYEVPKKYAVGIKVRGDSMQPKLFDQDIVILDTSIKGFINDDMYAFEYDGGCFIKKLQLTGRKLKAVSLNPEYEPWVIEHEELLHVVGKVKAAICKV